MTQPYPYPGPSGTPSGRPQYVGPGQPAPTHGSPAGYPPGPYQQSIPVYPVPAQAYPVVRRPPQRPAAVTMAAVMTVTASLQFVCALSFGWLVALAGIQDLPNRELGADSALYHRLRQFHLALVDGLAYPLYLVPLASFVLGFLILIPRPWTRWAYTVLGLVVLAWSAVWLHRQFVFWIPPALYILVACLIVWTPAASAWYRTRGRADQ